MRTLHQNTAASSVEMSPNCVAIIDGPEAFQALHKPACAASIWRREPLPVFQAWMDNLTPKQLPEGRLILEPEAVADAVKQLCEIAETPESTERDMLCNDITVLSEWFSMTLKCDYLRLRLEKVTDDACCKFHGDTITARLVCTYRGSGTQYCLPGEVQDGKVEPDELFTVPTGAPFLMRGSLWPETPYSDLKHRSPPIEGTGETRLLLVLDPISDPDDAI